MHFTMFDSVHEDLSPKPASVSQLEAIIRNKERQLEELRNSLKEIQEGHFINQSSELYIMPDWIHYIKEAVLVTDLSGKLVFVNNTASLDLGRSEQHLLAMHIQELEHFLRRDGAWESRVEELKIKNILVTEGIYLRGDGSTFPAEINASYVEIEGIGYITLVAKDISERKLTEHQLLKSESLLKEIMHNTSEAILLVEALTGSIADCNQMALHLFSYSNKTDLIGKSTEILQKDLFNDKESLSITSQLQNTGSWNTETILKNRIGEEFWCAISVSYVKIPNELSCYLVRLVNIDQKKKDEELLKASRKRYKDLVRYNQALICTHDIHGNILTVNPASLKSLNYESDKELIGNNLALLFEDNNREGYWNYLKQINETGASSGIMRVLSREGNKMYWLYRNYKVEEAGTEPYIVGSAQDITERVLIEKELKKAKLIAEKSLKARDLFLATMSHEVRTPLHGIMGVSDLLAKTVLNDTQGNYVNIIRHSAENLLVLMNNILDLAKIESGKTELESIPFNLCETLYHSIEPLIMKAQTKGLTFNIDMPYGELPVLKGDSHKLAQIVINLVNNALKFTNKGGISLIIEILGRTQKEVLLDVRIIDTGIGIPQDKLQTIFEEYTQADASHARIYGGTGLGLSICRKLAELHQGELYASSTEGIGSQFGCILRYKIATKDIPVTVEKYEIEFSHFRHLDVLVAEDNPINQLIAKKVLEQKEVLVDVAENGVQTLELLKKKKYDIVLMDIHMPDFGGEAVVEQIRTDTGHLNYATPVIALTANAMSGDNERYMQSGMNNYLSKPFTSHQLFQKITNTLHLPYRKSQNPKVVPEILINPSADHSFNLQLHNSLISAGAEITPAQFIKAFKKELDLLKNAVRLQDFQGISSGIDKLRPSIELLQNERLEESVQAFTFPFNENSYSRMKPELLRFCALATLLIASFEREFGKKK